MLWPFWDTFLFFQVNGIESNLLTFIMRTITNVDNWIPLLIGFILLLLWWGRTKPYVSSGSKWKRAFALKNPRIVLLCMILATSASDQVCYHLKSNVSRSRPCFEENLSGEVNYRGDVHGNRSFPSAHSANSAALATTISLAYPPLAPFAISVSILVGFSRIYLGVHYPIDVLTGWSIGALSAIIFWLLFRKMLSRPGLIGYTNRFRIRQPVPYSFPESPWIPVDISSLDGCPMTGYFLNSGKDLIIMIHGLHGNITSIAEPGMIFNRMGFSVFLVPLRGHDGHPVPVTSGGPAEVYDLAGAISHVREKMGFSMGRTILYGSSMGSVIALKMAGILGEPVAGIICHGAYRNFFTAAKMKLGSLRKAILKLLLPAGARRGLEISQSEDYVNNFVSTRYVFINGTRDRISPPSVGIQLASEYGGLFVALNEARHPVWSTHRWSQPQIEAAFKVSLEYIRGKQITPVAVDESGFIHDFPIIPEIN
ncbi:MAG: phosphatase PAP2 family protein [Candidatus Aegiribacteria sp.]|nr:phosphatase PAP2 family protein [Candidatus Aegiribacteria sp.]